MSRRNAVQRAFDAFGTEHFHEKRSGWWHRADLGVAQSLNLQRSQYGFRYYLNVLVAFDDAVKPDLAINPDDLGVGKRIEGRAEDLLADKAGDELARLLDMDDYNLEEEQREHRLLLLLEQDLEPALHGLSSLDGLVASYTGGRLQHLLVTRSATRVLEVLGRHS